MMPMSPNDHKELVAAMEQMADTVDKIIDAAKTNNETVKTLFHMHQAHVKISSQRLDEIEAELTKCKRK